MNAWIVDNDRFESEQTTRVLSASAYLSNGQADKELGMFQVAAYSTTMRGEGSCC